MTSIIKVDTLQDTGGNTILSSNGTGTFTYTAGAAGMGKVLQVVHSSATTTESTSSTSYVAYAALTGSITPSSTSSKIYIKFTVSNNSESTSGAGGFNHGAIYRQINGGGYSDIASPFMLSGIKQNGVMFVAAGSSMEYLDSPNTTSQCDYKLYYKMFSGTAVSIANDSTKVTITLMEIAG